MFPLPRRLRFPAAMVLLALLSALAATSKAQAPAAVEDMAHPQGTNAGIFAFTGRCAMCHDAGTGGAPDRYALNRRSPEEVLAKITAGEHARHADTLSEFQKRVVAVYVGGRPLGALATGDKSMMT